MVEPASRPATTAAVAEASLDADGDPSGFVTLRDGGRVAFEVRGAMNAGTPVLLVRPLAGSMALWGEFRDALAMERRVIAFDPRGVGASSDAPLDVTTRDMARDAVDVLDALGVPRAHVFGISLGAMVATWLAADAPERVERLCLASAGPVGLSLTPSGVASGATMAAAVLSPEGEVVRRLTDSLLSPDVRERDPARVEAIDEAAAPEPDRRAEIVKRAAAALRHDAREALPRITAPTLVLAGDRDALVGEEPPHTLAAGIAGARMEVIAGAGHALTLEQPRETARRVADFLRGAR